jgi:hypothetical protein
MKSLFTYTAAGVLAIVFYAGMNAAGAERVDLVNKDNSGLALRGYDPTAYFLKGQPVKGSPEFTHEWMGAKWRFASAEARDSFVNHPLKYAPQYGGYCAWAVSQNYTANADPEAWKIVDGKLYLNYNKSVQNKWQMDVTGNVSKADANWPQLHR